MVGFGISSAESLDSTTGDLDNYYIMEYCVIQNGITSI
jgi:hypothetical protein